MIRLECIEEYMENNRLEAKKAAGGLPHSLWETYSAFANTFGGLILLGIEETSQHTLHASGVSFPEEMVEEFWSIVQDPSRVSINILTSSAVSIWDVSGKKVIVIEVPRANRQVRPVYLGNDPYRGSYRRCGEGDYHCSPEEIRNMMRDRNNGLDERPLHQFSPVVFDEETVARYRFRFSQQCASHQWNAYEVLPFLEAVGAVKKTQEGLIPTAAGLLMFGQEQDIVKVYPGYYLDYREEAAPGRGEGFRILSGTGDWSGNLCDFYFCVNSRLTSWGINLLQHDQGKYTQVCEALAEALANGVIHGDYDGGTGLMVEKTWQRLTITNPGTLRVNPEQAMQGVAFDQRNSTLGKLFSYVGVGSGVGGGLRSVKTVWEQCSLGASVLKEQFHPDAVTLSLTIEMDMTYMENIREGVLSFLTDHIQSSGDVLATSLGVPRAKLDAVLQELLISGNIFPLIPDVYQLKQ